MSEVELNEPRPGGYSVTLPSFEGPLDLLLHLCQKHELDILDIPIGFVTEKYLEFLSVMQLMNLDLASEYLVMAATLAHIKSKMLLPAPPPGQEDELSVEEEDPREALIRRLLEYQKYKKAGEDLAARGVAGRDVFLRGMTIEAAVETGLPPLAQVPLFSLVEAFQNVLSKSKIKLSHDIVHERITLTDRINELVDVLRARKRIEFAELFNGLETRFDLVITFLALLEMTRLRMTRLFQADFDSGIYVEFTAQVGATEEEPEGAAAALDAPPEHAPPEQAPPTDAPPEPDAPLEPDAAPGPEAPLEPETPLGPEAPLEPETPLEPEHDEATFSVHEAKTAESDGLDASPFEAASLDDAPLDDAPPPASSVNAIADATDAPDASAREDAGETAAGDGDGEPSGEST